jgi:hypothetical protein
MAIDMASVYAARYRKQPDMLRAAVMGQSPDPKLDSYTALNALRLVKEADMMDMAGQAQQPTSSPSLVAQNMAPNPMQQGLGAMVPGAMGQAPQGMPPQQRAPMPQPTMQAASGGLAGMYTPEEDFAEGGIVAFQKGGLNRDADTYNGEAAIQAVNNAVAQEQFGMEKEDWPITTGDDGEADSTALGRAKGALGKYMDFDPKEMTTAEQEAFLDRYMARIKKAGGEDIYAPAKERLRAREAALAGDRKSGEGMALLTAAGAVLKGRNLAEGASNALPAYAQQTGEVKRAEQQEKRAIEQMNFSLADAQRKERMGDARGAQAALAEARKFQQDANRAQGEKLRYGADIAARTVQYSKTSGKGASAAKLAERLADAEEAYALNPTPENKARLGALSSAAAKMKSSTSFSTSENAPNKQSAAIAPIQQRVDAAVAQDIADFKLFSPEGAAYRRALRDKAPKEAARLLREAEKDFRATHSRTEGLTGAGEAAPGTAANPIVIK